MKIQNDSKTQLKIEIIGKKGAGKTSLIWNFVKNENFSGNCESIIQADYIKEMYINNNMVSFQITDHKATSYLDISESIQDKDAIILVISSESLHLNADDVIDSYINYIEFFL